MSSICGGYAKGGSSCERMKLSEKNETEEKKILDVENQSSFKETRWDQTTTSVVSTSGERQLTRQTSNNSETGIGAEATTNQAENDDSELSKSKSDASVQTDFVMRKSKKVLKKKYSNIFATNLITKISIWVSYDEIYN